MRTLFILTMLFCLLPMQMVGQKKQIQTAADQVKSGKDLDKAITSMQGLLKDSANRQNVKIWNVLIDAYTKQYEQGNEKLYLKEKYDTAALFNTTMNLFQSMSSLDTIEARPNKQGQVRLKYREDHARYLNSIRPNLFSGGVYFTRNKQYEKAFAFYNEYILSSDWPLFSSYNYREKDPLIPHAAYWAMYCGYKMGSSDCIIKYQDLAERDTSMLNFVRQYQAEAYLLRKDTVHYVQALLDGFNRYPNFAYFYPRLIDYYESNDNHVEALKVADRAMEADSTSRLFRVTRSAILLNLGRYAESIEISQALIAENDTLAEPYYYIGLAYFNQAIELDKVDQRDKKLRQQIMNRYQQALPYLEKYRALAPQQKQRWLYPLYTIYLNLNMGKEFDAIDKLRSQP